MKILKNSIYIFLGLLSALISCDEDSTGGVSRITVFPEFTYNGEELIFLERGAEFTDPGVTAVEAGTSLPVEVSASGTYFGGNTFDASKPDIYTITYSATNSDGFAGEQHRTVIVAGEGDLVNNIEGLYTSTVGRNGAPAAPYLNMKYVLIRKTGDNTYQLSDGIGGYYDLGRGYGPAYSAGPVLITANNILTNDFTFGAFQVGTFGGPVTIVSMTVNALTKTITFQSKWDIYTFDVTLTQVAL